MLLTYTLLTEYREGVGGGNSCCLYGKNAETRQMTQHETRNQLGPRPHSVCENLISCLIWKLIQQKNHFKISQWKAKIWLVKLYGDIIITNKLKGQNKSLFPTLQSKKGCYIIIAPQPCIMLLIIITCLAQSMHVSLTEVLQSSANSAKTLKALLYQVIVPATCLAILSGHKLQEKLPSVTSICTLK